MASRRLPSRACRPRSCERGPGHALFPPPDPLPFLQCRPAPDAVDGLVRLGELQTLAADGAASKMAFAWAIWMIARPTVDIGKKRSGSACRHALAARQLPAGSESAGMRLPLPVRHRFMPSHGNFLAYPAIAG
jgi:hypothetical protein